MTDSASTPRPAADPEPLAADLESPAADPEPLAADLESPAAAPFAGTQARRPRERLLESVLRLSGERGYEEVSVSNLVERAGTSRGTFYNHFKDKEDCFAQAYDEASEWLYQRLSTLAGRQPNWREGLQVALAEMLEFCASQPATAKALLIEPHAAGDEALAQHDRMLERISGDLDRARGEVVTEQPRTELTSPFLIASIESMITAKLSSDEAEKLPTLLPGLLHFVVMQYLGKDAAWEDMKAASVATWDARRRAASDAS